MGRAFLRAKAKLWIAGEPYEVERQCTDGVWVLKHDKTQRQLEQSTDQLFDAYAAGTLAFVRKTLKTFDGKPRATQVLSCEDGGPEFKKAKIRRAFVKAISGLPRSRKEIEAAIEKVWEVLKDRPQRKPNWVTVYRWARAFDESGERMAALVTNNADKGNRSDRFDEGTLEKCAEVIEDKYLTDERPGVQDVVNLAKAEVRRFNRQCLEAKDRIKLPTYRLMQRLIAAIPEYDKHVARYGREPARKRFRSALKNRLTERPLQRSEIDHTRMDLLVIDDEYGLPMGRPWLTILIDDFSRVVLGYCLSFEPPSRATVARCLRHAFMPKTGLQETYPDLKNDWSQFGVVSELCMDGGVEFHSAELERICFELDIEQHFAPRRTPWFKGKVERFQGTLNRAVTITTPGKTFEGIIDRADYDPAKHAIVTLSTLHRLIVRWIVDVYHQRLHKALGCTPAQMWANNIKAHDIPMMEDPVRLDAILGGDATRVLTHKGVQRVGLDYNSVELGALRQEFGERLEVQIRFDRSNLGSIVVLHPQRGTPIRVPCVQVEYAEGLTEWQHNVCKRYAREQWKREGDPDAWLDALLEISEIVEREMAIGQRKGAARERIARWRESQSAAARAASKTAVAKVEATRASTALPLPVEVPQPGESVMPIASAANTPRKRMQPIFEERSAATPHATDSFWSRSGDE